MKIAQEIVLSLLLLFYLFIYLFFIIIIIIFFFFFFLLKHAPIKYIKREAPEIGANPALYSNLWQQSYSSRGPTNHRKRAEKGLFSSCLFGTTKMVAVGTKVYVCLFVTKNMGMFIATGLTLKR